MSDPITSAAWQPNATLATLQKRAQLLQDIRQFFATRQVIEVDPPLLCDGVATDPGLQAFAVNTASHEEKYLQTSPEFAMKRLLAAGSGAIYSLGKAFRKGELGAKHNPEFTMLEWYRPGWDHFQLIEEVDALLQAILKSQPAKLTTYLALFEQYFNIHPHLASTAQLQSIALTKGWIDELVPDLDKDGWLDLLFTQGIEPYLTGSSPVVILEYPASQASLSRIKTVGDPVSFEVAERFEFYYQGMELANGYYELTCPDEQRSRFEQDLAKRKILQLPELPVDRALLAALSAGLPSCAGVALGVDRLLMLKLKQTHINQVLPFGWERA